MYMRHFYKNKPIFVLLIFSYIMLSHQCCYVSNPRQFCRLFSYSFCALLFITALQVIFSCVWALRVERTSTTPYGRKIKPAACAKSSVDRFTRLMDG